LRHHKDTETEAKKHYSYKKMCIHHTYILGSQKDVSRILLLVANNDVKKIVSLFNSAHILQSRQIKPVVYYFDRTFNKERPIININEKYMYL